MARNGKGNCDIYGPDLSVHEEEGKQIAETGLKCMKGTGATGSQEESDGPSASKNDLESLR